MKLEDQKQKGHEFLHSIYTKAWHNETFKQALVDNPIETLNTFTGKNANIPAGRKLLVEDQTNPNHIYLNIPIKPNFSDTELTEEQLEIVAGGGWIDDFVTAAVTVYNWSKVL